MENREKRRCGRPVVYGKGFDVVRFRIPTPFKLALEAQTSNAGMPLTELVRRLIAVHVIGGHPIPDSVPSIASNCSEVA